MALGATVRDLRQRNRTRILRSMVLAGETTRARLAAACWLSTASITNVVSGLIAEGLVQEVGSVPSDGGRPIARLSVRPEGAYLIGADVAERRVTVELFDLAMRPIDRVDGRVRRGAATVAKVGRELTAAIARLRATHPEAERALVGVGLGVPGLVEPTPTGVTIYADQLGWPPTDLRDLCDLGDLPVYADNGAKALALGEQWFGAARGVDHAVVALVGRGIGAGIISDGQLLRGQVGNAGEWGHTKLSAGGPECRCGDRGCLEAWVGGAAIVSRWRERAGSQAANESDEEGAFAALIEAATAGDAAANAVLDETVELLGIGLANLVNLFNPEIVTIGGWAGRTLHAARPGGLADAVRAHCLPRPGGQFRLVPCALGSDAVPLGAALLPLQRLIEGSFRLREVTA